MGRDTAEAGMRRGREGIGLRISVLTQFLMPDVGVEGKYLSISHRSIQSTRVVVRLGDCKTRPFTTCGLKSMVLRKEQLSSQAFPTRLWHGGQLQCEPNFRRKKTPEGYSLPSAPATDTGVGALRNRAKLTMKYPRRKVTGFVHARNLAMKHTSRVIGIRGSKALPNTARI